MSFGKKHFGLILGLVCGMAGSGFSQSPQDLEVLKSRYQDEAAVILTNKEDVRLFFENGQLKILSKVFTDQYLINEQLQNITDERIYYNETFDEISEVDAAALLPHKKKYKRVPVTDVETRSKLSNSIFYHDNYYKEIIFPKLESGSRTVLSYDQEIKDPHFLGSFYFSSFIPIMESAYTIRFPESVKVRYKLFNDPQGLISFEEKVERGERVLTWKANEIRKFETARDAPPLSYYEPHVVVYIEEYTVGGKTHKVLADVEDLYGWYRELIKGVNHEPSPELKAISDSLTQGLNTDLEKVKSIYGWVQQNIKYVAFEDGMSGFIPREASAVCSRRYGDCKDMASIITELLEAADIEAHLTWIGSRDIPYTYSELPTPAVDNHMIASVEVDGQLYFMDATDSYIPLDMPSSFIQGKEALIGVTENDFRLESVPVVARDRNTVNDAISLKLDGEDLKGAGQLQLNGYPKVNFLSRFLPRDESDRKDYLTARLEKGHNKFKLSDYAVENAASNAKASAINYTFEVPDYAKQVAGAIYVNLNLDRTWENGSIKKEDRKDLSKEMEFKFERAYSTKLEIPEGYTVTYLPEPLTYENANFGFSVAYETQGSEVVMTKKLYLDTLYITKDQFSDWNAMIDQLRDAYSEAVVMKQQ